MNGEAIASSTRIGTAIEGVLAGLQVCGLRHRRLVWRAVGEDAPDEEQAEEQ
jgi:hypothetical protein